MPRKEIYKSLSPEEKKKHREAALRRYYESKKLDPKKAARKSKEYRDNHPEKMLFYYAKNRAKACNLEFSLRLSDIVIPENCPVFGTPLIRKMDGVGSPCNDSPTLDRVDTTRGYTPDNVWVISFRANRIKCDGSLQEFDQLISSLENINSGANIHE